MITIDRKQAEDLLGHSELVNSKLNQDKKELCITLKLSDGKTVLMKYNISNKIKSYFLKQIDGQLKPKR